MSEKEKTIHNLKKIIENGVLCTECYAEQKECSKCPFVEAVKNAIEYIEKTAN